MANSLEQFATLRLRRLEAYFKAKGVINNEQSGHMITALTSLFCSLFVPLTDFDSPPRSDPI